MQIKKNNALIVIDIEETGKYFLDSKKHICKEVIHVVSVNAERSRLIVFKRMNFDGPDLDMFKRNESNMIPLPKELVEGMFLL